MSFVRACAPPLAAKVNLVSFSTEHLRVNGSLPFDVVDAAGALLMPKGAVIASDEQLRNLLSHRLFVDHEQTEQWRRGLAGEIDRMVRGNVSLKSIAQARSEAPTAPSLRPAPAAAALQPLPVELSQLQLRLSALLREARPDAAWLARLLPLAQRLRQLVARDADALLYLLIQATTHEHTHYSSHHALVCAVTVELCADTLGWPVPQVDALRHAALTMNLGMTALQDALALQSVKPTPAQRAQIDRHAAVGAQMLRDAGVDDALWIEVVAAHHDEPRPAVALGALGDSERLRRLLRRVDVFTAKISPRKGRHGMPATLAARDACLGADGGLDEIGAAVIKALGIYPPGSYVRLASGETAVVLHRGLRANRPKVASIARADGQPLGVPAVRDTGEPRHAVEGAVRVQEVRVRLNHERMLALT
jgi:hypothetical protein